ncbi:MAG: CDP-alcohol phosphatidyltransferase family protein [Flavobacteriales bacterium]
MQSIIRFIPNLLTLSNAALGVLGMIFVAHEEMVSAVVCVGIALVLDFLDGFVARLFNAQSELGVQLDSLADMITFGALPGMILFQMISISKGIYFLDMSRWTMTEILSCSVALLVPMAGAYRLAVFNLDKEKRDHFLGLPIPAMAMFVMSIPLVLEAHYSLNFYYRLSDSFIDIIGMERKWDYSDYWVVKHMFRPWFYQLWSVILAAMMVVRIPMLSLKFKGLSWGKNKWRYGILIWALISYIIFLVPYTDIFFIEFGLIDYLILPIFMLGYFLLSWIYAIFGASKLDLKSDEIQS